jgi:hypothetical protein
VLELEELKVPEFRNKAKVLFQIVKLIKKSG